KAIESYNDDIKELEEELDFVTQSEQMEDIFNTLARIVGLKDYEMPALTDNSKENIKILNKEFDNLFNKDFDSFNKDNKEDLESYIKELEDIPDLIEYLDKRFDKVDFTEIFDLKSLEDYLEQGQSKLNKFKKEQEKDEIEALVTDVQLEQMDSLAQEIENIKDKRNELEEVLDSDSLDEESNLYKQLEKAIESYNDDIKDLEEQRVFGDQAKQLEDIFNTLARMVGLEDYEMPILTDSSKENIKILNKEFDNLFNKDFDSFNEDNIEDLRSYIKEIEDIPKLVEYLDKDLKNIDLFEFIDLEALDDLLEKGQLELEKLQDNIQVKEIKDIVQEEELQKMNDLDAEIIDVTNSIEEWQKMQDDVAKKEGRNSDLYKRITQIIKGYKEELKELNDESEKKQLIEQLEESGEILREDILKSVEDFDIDKILSIQEAQGSLQKYGNYLNIIKDEMAELKDQGILEDKELEESYNNIIKMLKEAIDETEYYIFDTQLAWAEAINNGLDNAFDNFDIDEDSLKRTLGMSIVNTINNALESDEINLNLDKVFSPEIALGAETSLSGLQQGESIGKSIMSGIGSGLMATGDPLTMLGGLGVSLVGQIGEAIWGGQDSSDIKREAEEIEKAQEDVIKKLKDFGVETDKVNTNLKETSDLWDQIWGNENWEADNLDEAKEHLEDIEEILQSAESLSSDIMSGFEQAVKDNVRYEDMRQHFEKSLGQAIKDAVISNLIEAEGIQEQIDELTGDIFREMQDGEIDRGFLESIEDEVDSIMESGKAFEEIHELFEELYNLESPDVDANQTFQAGSSRSIAYHQQFVVKSQIFNGTRSEARLAAKKLAPYIEEYINREEGE
ncbi:MAG: hypothetical protein ACOCRO_07330, partial [Halanaerobiales bacterium]